MRITSSYRLLMNGSSVQGVPLAMISNGFWDYGAVFIIPKTFVAGEILLSFVMVF